jgi:hypothetical protein
VRALNDSAAGESAVFTVISGDPVIPGGAPTLQLLSPNGGENWPSGGTRNITWTAANWSGNVQLSLHQNGVSKGIIALVPSVLGTHPWTVGKTDKGSAAVGGGYRVHISRVYNDMKPHAALVDKSDGDFAIGAMKPGETLPINGLQVVLPAEGSVIEYSSLIVNGERAVIVPCRWSTDGAGPYQFFLHTVGNKAEAPLQPIKDPVSLGNGTYEAELKLSTKNSSPGWYKIHVKSVDKGGYSGKFQLKYKLHEVTLEPLIENHQDLHDDGAYYSSIFEVDANLPGQVRVGFRNQTKSDYHGAVYRSRIVFDLSRFKNLKGEFQEAKLKITRAKFLGSADMDFADCDTRAYILAEPWPGGNFSAIPGNLIQNFPKGVPNHFDIPDWATAWTNGASPNHGLLFVGGMEKYNHDNLFCVNYYRVRLQVKFQEN